MLHLNQLVSAVRLLSLGSRARVWIRHHLAGEDVPPGKTVLLVTYASYGWHSRLDLSGMLFNYNDLYRSLFLTTWRYFHKIYHRLA